MNDQQDAYGQSTVFKFEKYVEKLLAPKEGSESDAEDTLKPGFLAQHGFM